MFKIKFFHFRNFSSLTHINLGFNRLEQILDNTFGNYPNLENFNLTNNNINSLGNNLGLLNNPDTEIDLSDNNIEYLLGTINFRIVIHFNYLTLPYTIFCQRVNLKNILE